MNVHKADVRPRLGDGAEINFQSIKRRNIDIAGVLEDQTWRVAAAAFLNLDLAHQPSTSLISER